jgi:hypothetical protein
MENLDKLPLPPDELHPAETPSTPLTVVKPQTAAAGMQHTVTIKFRGRTTTGKLILILLGAGIIGATVWKFQTIRRALMANETAHVHRDGHKPPHAIHRQDTKAAAIAAPTSRSRSKSADKKKPTAKKSKHRPWLAR